MVVEGFRVPPIPATPGRTQLTPSVSRSVGAELAGAAMSLLGIKFSLIFGGQIILEEKAKHMMGVKSI